ncbi:MAG: DNA-directed RNA polymerase subunit alpha C-terminal domain-containing protein [Oscillospiraceae bacterium]
MKYDSSMTQFHGDIVSAIKAMIFPGKSKAKELASEGSPVPLREFIKRYGKDRFGGRNFECTPSAFFVVFDNIILNNSGDQKLQFSWSQVATFIRNNAAEIFDESEEEGEKSNMENGKSSLEIDVLDLDVKSYNTLKRAGINTIADVARLADNLTSSIQLPEAHRKAIEAYKSYRDSQGQQDKPSEPPAPVQSEASVAASFDYSTLDTDTAKSLRNCEAVIRQETAGYFTILGAKFKEAQDLLANHSTGTFERWYTSMGFKRQTVYNLIQRYEFSSSPTIGGREEAFENISLTLSYDISKPDAPSELVEQVMNGDITTHKDYIALKKELELAQQSNKSLQEANDHIFNASKENYKNYDAERIKNYELEKQLAQVKKDLKELNEERERNAELEERDDELQRKNDVLVLKNQELEQRVKELENRPVEVAVQSDEKALAEKEQEISELKGEVERLSNKNVKVFAVRLTLDEYEKLVQIVCGGCRGGNDPVILEAVKKAQIIRL